MAASPMYKVWLEGKYIASTKDPVHALMLVSAIGDGEIRYTHRHTVWKEGHEGFEAGESYDLAADKIEKRVKEIFANYRKKYGKRK